jgi:putative ABC transport system substrate-binding protein
MAIGVRRRQFISALAGATIAWPLAARAQQLKQMRRIGVLMNTTSDYKEGHTRLAGFVQALRAAGWVDGDNVQIDTRWPGDDGDRIRKFAAELVAQAPDVILASTTPAVTALQQASRSVPIVFVGVIDPVGSGLVTSFARPGGNATGFVVFEYSLAAKWLELLKEIAPGVTRAAVLRDPTVAAGIGQFAAIQTVGSIGMELSAIDLRDADAIVRDVAAYARDPNGGLIVTASNFGANNPELIATVAAKQKLPAVYPFNYFIRTGGLISYGVELADDFRRAAGYVDRILKGTKTTDLPVQAPTKYLLSVNLKAAKALGLVVSQSLLARADEVIE